MLLNVINRPGDCYAAMRRLLTDNDEPPVRQRRAHPPGPVDLPRAAQLRGGRAAGRARRARAGLARLTVDLQPEFALNQPLSPFALAAVDLLDREAETYALDVVSVIESTLEDPRPVLSRAALQGPRRGGRGDEARRDRVRGADGPAGGRHLSAAAGRAARGGATRRTRESHPWVLDDG